MKEMDENGRCKTCLQPFNWWTDGNGRAVASHPLGPCKPPVPKEWGMIKCQMCPKVFDPTPTNGGPYRRVCSERCRIARDKATDRERRQRAKEILTGTIQLDMMLAS